MTFREKLQKEHPEAVDEIYGGGCRECPCDYGYEQGNFCDCDCKECWDREIPEDNEGIKKELKGTNLFMAESDGSTKPLITITEDKEYLIYGGKLYRIVKE